MTFSGLQDAEPIENFYNHGLGGDGSGPGPSYGITFGTNAVAPLNYPVHNTDSSPLGGSASMVFTSGSAAVLNAIGGLTNSVSFSYSAPVDTGSVLVYSGTNGTGSLLASMTLSLTTSGSPAEFSVWKPIDLSFVGTAESIEFAGTANQLALYGITLTEPAVGSVPEPPSLVVWSLLAVVSIGFYWQRKAAVRAIPTTRSLPAPSPAVIHHRHLGRRLFNR